MRKNQQQIISITIIFFILLITTEQNLGCGFASYMTSKNQCSECLSGCSKCHDLISPCAGCSQGYIFNSVINKCDRCKQGQLTCESNTITCQPHYIYRKEQCFPVCQVLNCQTCSNIFDKTCLVCDQGFKLNKPKTECLFVPTRNLQTTDFPSIANTNHLISNLNKQINLDISPLNGLKDNLTTQVKNENIGGNLDFSNNGLHNTKLQTDSIFNPITVPTTFNKSIQIQQPIIISNQTQITNQSSIKSNQLFNDPKFNSDLKQAVGTFSKTEFDTPTVTAPVSDNLTINIKNNMIPQNITIKEEFQKTNNKINETEPAKQATQIMHQMNLSPNEPENKDPTLKSIQNKHEINCPIGSYESNGQCFECYSKCATCINQADKCLQCAYGWRKNGWKCVKNESILFNFTLAAPQNTVNSTQTNTTVYKDLGDYLNEFKRNLISSVLPQDYADFNISIITLDTISLNQNTDTISISGMIDRMTSTKLIDLKNFINKKLSKVPLMVDHFPITYSNIQEYPLFTATGTKENNVNQNSNSNYSAAKSSNINVVAIVVPVVLGSLILFGLISCLLCYYCGWGFFKKRSKEQHENPDEKAYVPPTTTERVFMQNEQVGQIPQNFPEEQKLSAVKMADQVSPVKKVYQSNAQSQVFNYAQNNRESGNNSKDSPQRNSQIFNSQ